MARVLLIENCPDFRAWARCTLEREGFDVIEAGDALAGLQRAVEDAPDCVVVADALLGLDGLDVTSRLAQAPATAGLPVFVSGEPGDTALPRAARAAGARGVLPRTARAVAWTAPLRVLLGAADETWMTDEGRDEIEPVAL